MEEDIVLSSLDDLILQRVRLAQEDLAIRQAESARREKAVRLKLLEAELGSRYSIEKTALKTFEIYHAGQRAILDRLRSLEAILASGKGTVPGLVLYGPVGTGKDRLLAAMLYAACSGGRSCRWISGQAIYGRFRDSIDTGHKESSIVGELCKPDILAISDPIPPVGEPTAWNVTQLGRVIDGRYRLNLVTWITMNAVSEADADAKLSAPVFDRIRDGAEVLPCFWPSYRGRRKT